MYLFSVSINLRLHCKHLYKSTTCLSPLLNTSILSLLPGFATNIDIYIDFGKLGLIFLTIAIMAGIFRTYPLISKNWRWFHRLNYIVFGLILIHSFFLGTDIKTAPFVYLYPIFIVGLITSVVYKLKKF